MEIENILNQIDSLPAPSAVTLKLTELMNTDNWTISDLGELVAMDASLSARCLKTVNSTAYGLNREIMDVEQALLFIGAEGVFQLALKDSTGNTFFKPLLGYESEKGELWHSSLLTAYLSKNIIEGLDMPGFPSVAFVAGLLNNIGKIALSEYLEKDISKAKELLRTDNESDFLKIERECVGIDHCEAGYYLGKVWHLPEVFLEVIRFHHHPNNAKEIHHPYVNVVHLADQLAMLMKNDGFDQMSYNFDLADNETLKISPEDLEKILRDSYLLTKSSMEKVWGDG